MSNEGSNELIFGADTYEGAFDEGAESQDDSHDGIADTDHFSLCSVHSANDDNILNTIEDPPCSVQPVDIELDSVDNSNDDESESEEKPIPRGKSIAHHYVHRKLVYVSLDLEQGGEYCGIVQLQCQLF